MCNFLCGNVRVCVHARARVNTDTYASAMRAVRERLDLLPSVASPHDHLVRAALIACLGAAYAAKAWPWYNPHL
jgi:hypothetical protein